MVICVECNRHFIGLHHFLYCLHRGEMQVNPLTGDLVEIKCKKKNPDGKCKDYEAKESKK